LPRSLASEGKFQSADKQHQQDGDNRRDEEEVSADHEKLRAPE
jgi:hypothetical protein